MSKPVVITRMTLPNNRNVDLAHADSTVEVAFDFNPMHGEMFGYFKTEEDIKEFFEEITEYACYKINRDLKAGRSFRNE